MRVVSLSKKNRVGAPPQPSPPRINCPFCSKRLPRAETMVDLASAEGCQGGRCTCGAVFVVDDVGRFGGQALLDALTLACQGDIERALKIDAKKGFEVKTGSLAEAARERRRRNLGLEPKRRFESKRRNPGQSAARQGRRRSPKHGYLEPKIWAVRLKGPNDT